MEQRLNQMMWERMRQDNESRLKMAQDLAKNENPIGLYDMAVRYMRGYGVVIDSDQAIKYYVAAAERGHAGACVELSKLFLMGNEAIGIKPNLKEALKYATSGAESDVNLYNSLDYKQKQFVEEAKGLKVVIMYVQQQKVQEQNQSLRYAR